MKTFKFSIVLFALILSKSLVQANSFNAPIIITTQDSPVAIKGLRISDFKVLERGAITIYERQRPGDKLNLFKPVITHYFSVKGADQVYLYTLENLKKIFRNGRAFEVLDTRFRTDSDLLIYDAIHQQYSVNYYLSKVDPS
ncbi:DUF4197 domain-containing protein [Mucilaginibacter sp. HC2]|uniref:DUF4197 domain-containing protein n=1 Tax=Mucilaginibacter inviolabilis TaxID=2714892 RepID=UPI00140BB5AC|nr:DUF4197 domain-containing protein [Mucilaginibacter inviolabilis]NHA03705.1 DUF4197 domain-containing protein [Mucilaginibacter inviolabilis]